MEHARRKTTRIRYSRIQQEDRLALQKTILFDPEEDNRDVKSYESIPRRFRDIPGITVEIGKKFSQASQDDINERRVYQFRRYLELLKIPRSMTREWRNYGQKHFDEIFAYSNHLT